MGDYEQFKTFYPSHLLLVTLGTFRDEREVFYMPSQSTEGLTQQRSAAQPVSFLALLDMGGHACMLFSIERHMLQAIKQPRESYQVLTDVQLSGQQKILWACSNGHLVDRTWGI